MPNQEHYSSTGTSENFQISGPKHCVKTYSMKILALFGMDAMEVQLSTDLGHLEPLRIVHRETFSRICWKRQRLNLAFPPQAFVLCGAYVS